MLTSFLLSLSQSALTIITVIRNVTAPLAKTIATATVVIVGTGTEKGTGTAAGETETTATVSLTVIGNAQTEETAIAIGIVNAVVIAKKYARRATRRNADGSTRVKMTDAGHTPARMKEAPLAVPAVDVAVSVTVARQIVAHPHPWARFRSRNASARPAVGMSMHRAMNSTRPCRRNKPVRLTLFGCLSTVANIPTQGCSTFLEQIAPRFHLFWLSPVFRRPCLFPHLAWVWQ